MAITGEAGFPYTVAEFAAKHSLCLQQANIVLRANKKSREQADQGAVIFKQMVAARSERVQTNGRGGLTARDATPDADVV